VAARELLDDSKAWPEREQALERLDRALLEHQQDPEPLTGELGQAVVAELEAWSGFAKGIRVLRQAIADPRLRPKALEHLRQVPAHLGVADSADLFLGLIDRLDKHQRWLRLESVRQDLAGHLRDVQTKLEPNAIGHALREEVLVVCATLDQLVQDEQSCLIAALSHPAVAALPGSAFRESRLQEVPHRASLREMPGWGVCVDLARSPGPGDALRLKVDGYDIELTADVARVGPTTQAIAWRGGTRVYAALRYHQLLVRVVGASPSDITVDLPQGVEASAKFTVRAQGDLELKGVHLAQIPENRDR
jgi:hypothetical protein